MCIEASAAPRSPRGRGSRLATKKFAKRSAKEIGWLDGRGTPELHHEWAN
jgi:hypothetical protein